MTWTLLVLGHRPADLYRLRAIRQLDEVLGLSFFDRLVMCLDLDGVSHLADRPRTPWEVHYTGGGKGLIANVQQAWDALGDDEWVFHLEEDFLVSEAPLDALRAVLRQNPMVAQMVLERQPLNAAELANGGLLGGNNIPTYTARGGPRGPYWREQSHLFSFNPCVYHSGIATKAGTETHVTQRLRADGWTFGFWGAQGDPPRCQHIGAQGGMGSPGWRV